MTRWRWRTDSQWQATGDKWVLSLKYPRFSGSIHRMTCCRCDRKGACQSCVCACEGKFCTNCLPRIWSENSNRAPNVHSREPAWSSVHLPIWIRSRWKYVQRHTLELPSFASANPYNQFKWGENDGEKIAAYIDSIYTQIVHWKHNLFKVPSGKYGKVFVQELACLFNAYGEASAMELVALKAAMIFLALVLQKPFKSSKSRDHVSYWKANERVARWQVPNPPWGRNSYPTQVNLLAD